MRRKRRGGVFGGSVEQLGERAVISSKDVRPLGSPRDKLPHPSQPTPVRTEDRPILNRSRITPLYRDVGSGSISGKKLSKSVAYYHRHGL